MATPPPDRTLDAGLAAVAGWCDTCGFVALSGLFTAHVTGNLVVLGAVLLAGGSGYVAKLLALPVFVAGVMASRAAYDRLRAAGQPATRLLLRAQAALLTAFALLGLLLAPNHDPDAPLAALCGLTGVLALSIQNALGRLGLNGRVPSTVMTGNVTQAALDGWGVLRAAADADAARGRLRAHAPALGGFLAGVLLGAATFWLVGFACVLVPAAATLLLAQRIASEA